MLPNQAAASDAEPTEKSSSADALPLCVDLDGTLAKCDTLSDALCLLARSHAAMLFRLPSWLLAGRANLKRNIGLHAPLDVARLPYNETLLVYLREQRAMGRQAYLCTGADRLLADRVAAYIGLFQGVFASDGALNLTGHNKLQLLESYFGPGNFVYIGNSHADMHLIKSCGGAMLANPVFGLGGRLRRQNLPVQRCFVDRAPLRESLRRALRLHQWAKNVLIFLPLLLAHAIRLNSAFQALLAFFSFSLVASSTYIVNDLLDLASDRSHPVKRRRPFAAGNLSVTFGLVLTTGLFVCGICLARLLPDEFTGWLLAYCCVTLAYSLYWKRVVLVDVIILSALYTLRIMAGAAATRVPVSHWMAAFSIFFFFSLALIKRFSELENLRARGTDPSNGRGYLVHDMEQMRAFGTSSAFASIVVFTLYINNSQVRQLYHHPQRLWLLTPMLIWWLSRVWLRASRGQMNEDPVVFALTDPGSLLAGVVIFLIALSAAV
ncbi:MAG TPA: UbiA family prenyltransferase [Acidobacteriaceae bacterium]|nr:UbiA family prenyltransferase [Acidobacteriaceae bacterium]